MVSVNLNTPSVVALSHHYHGEGLLPYRQAHPPTPIDYPSGLPGPGCYWCLPPSICTPCAAWLPCILLGLLLVLCLPSSCSLWHQRQLPCVGLYNPLHRFGCVEELLCTTALRYSSLMFQDPQGTSVKAREFPLWSLCASSPSVLCCRLAPPPSFLRVGFSLCWCLRPAPAAPPVLLPCCFVLPLPL